MARNLVARQLLRLFRLVEDPSPQLGGDLDSNGFDVNMADDDIIWFGTGNDARIVYSPSSDAFIITTPAGTTADVEISAQGVLRLIADNSDDFRLVFGTESAGDLLYNTNGDGTLARLPIGDPGEVLQVNPAGTAPEWGTLGILGHAEVTTNQTGIVGTIVDLTGLTVTFTVAGSVNRVIQTMGHCSFISPSGGAGRKGRLRLRDGAGTTLQFSNTPGPDMDTAANTGPETHVWIVEELAPGSHTRKLSAERVSGATSLTMDTSSIHPAEIVVEDLGPA